MSPAQQLLLELLVVGSIAAFTILLLVLIAASFVGIWWASHRFSVAVDANRARLAATGSHAPARILGARETGTYVNHAVQVELDLEITPPDDHPFPWKLTTLVSIVQIPAVQPGSLINVCYDPRQRNKMFITTYG